jgi:SAM-dependent methyltransferase
MVVFKGLSDSVPALYVPAMGSHQTPEALMLRSKDGIKFDIVSKPGMGFPSPFKPRGVRAIVSFKNHLFTSPAAGQGKKASNIAEFMIIGVNDDPSFKDWELACQPSFGDPNNLTVFDMAEFNGFLYAGTLNINEGFQIWKTDAEGKPPFIWKKVITNGAYRGKLNQIAMTLQPFGNHLYVGTAIQEGGYNYENRVGPASLELIRINADDSWDLIVGESRITPDGFKLPLSGLGPGFGRPFGGYLWAMCVHDGWLYAGTFDWLVLVKWSNRDGWPEIMRQNLPHQRMKQILHEYGGFDLWRSKDGCSWVPITQNGFGNCYNYGVRCMQSTPYGLFVGVANPFGPEVAIRRVAGWRYEKNPDGGLEIWLGSLHYPFNKRSDIREKEMTSRSKDYHFERDRQRASNQDVVEELIDEFYGGTGFRNFGFWGDNINEAKLACENLVDEMLAFFPQGKGNIVEIGCTFGATTQYLLNFFQPDVITGVCSSRKKLRICRNICPNIRFIYSKLPKLRLPAESADYVIWIEISISGSRRRKLLQEIFRVLKPRGQLVCFDILRSNTQKASRQRIFLDKPNYVATIVEYNDLLNSTGFVDNQFIDVTVETIGGFRKHLAKFLRLRQISSGIEPDKINAIYNYLGLNKLINSQSLLISACKQ